MGPWNKFSFILGIYYAPKELFTSHVDCKTLTSFCFVFLDAWTIWLSDEGAWRSEGNWFPLQTLHTKLKCGNFNSDNKNNFLYIMSSFSLVLFLIFLYLQNNLVSTENKLVDANDQISELKRWVDVAQQHNTNRLQQGHKIQLLAFIRILENLQNCLTFWAFICFIAELQVQRFIQLV